MTLTEHISDEIFARYARRNAGAPEILQVQTHIAACAACRAKLARIVDEEKAFTAAIHADFAFEDCMDDPAAHLDYEQLEFFVDDKLDGVDREIATSHLAICAECAKDLHDLRMYREIAVAAPAKVSEPIAESSKRFFWQKIFDFGSVGSFAPIAAILLIAVFAGAWFFLLRENSGGEIAQSNVNQNMALSNFNAGNNSPAPDSSPETSPTISPALPEAAPKNETQYALNDGQLKIDDRGNVLAGAENLSPSTQNLIKQSLQSEKISVANNLPGGSNSGVLMSERNAENGVPFALRAPIGKIILENQPELRWKPLPGAQNYSVAIVDEKFRVVAESGKLSGTSWKPSKALPRGANYSWQVTAVKADGAETVSPSSPAPQARFRVVEQNLFDEISRLKQSGKPSRLALGVLYAKAGLRQEARIEFEKLLRENPASPLARKLLQSVK